MKIKNCGIGLCRKSTYDFLLFILFNGKEEACKCKLNNGKTPHCVKSALSPAPRCVSQHEFYNTKKHKLEPWYSIIRFSSLVF